MVEATHGYLLEGSVAGLDADAWHEADGILHVANATQFQTAGVEAAHRDGQVGHGHV